MAYVSEPVRVGKIVSDTFAFIGAEWRALLAFAVLPAMFGVAYMAFIPSLTSAGVDAMAASQYQMMHGRYLLTLGLLTFVASHFAYAAALAFSIDRLAGRETGVGPAFKRGLRLYLPLLAIRVLAYLAAWFGLIFFIVPGVILYIMFFVADAVYTDERTSITGALGRSRALTKGSRWRIFVLLLLLMLFFWALSAVQMALMLLPNGEQMLRAFTVASSLFTYVLIPPLTAVLFQELRTLKEGDVANDVAAVF